MIPPDKMDNIMKYVASSKKEEPVFQTEISEILHTMGFSGDDFMSPNATNMETRRSNGKISSFVYKYFNQRFNVFVNIYYNKRKEKANAEIIFKDYSIRYDHLSLGKLVAIIKLLG